MGFNSLINHKKEKVIVIMGPTGSGKSRLSLDLATRFPGEIVNCDKLQVYKGLNIVTNKISLEKQLGIPHYLLGEVDSPNHGEFKPSEFRSRASHVISKIVGHGKVPYIVGGSNSFIHALLAETFLADLDVFGGFAPICSDLRYECCFLWVDVSLPVLEAYLKKRVDDMVDAGMVDELARYYKTEFHNELRNIGLTKAIGVPEFERYFKNMCGDDLVMKVLYEDAVKAVKDNTCELAKRQIEKILRLRGAGWDLHRLDGTNSFRAVLDGSKSCMDVWEREVVEPSVKLVKNFLEEDV